MKVNEFGMYGKVVANTILGRPFIRRSGMVDALSENLAMILVYGVSITVPHKQPLLNTNP